MKILFLILFATLTQAQNLLLFGDDFNPLTYDANVLALYDGDNGLTIDVWADQSINGYDLTLNNDPTLVSGAINGHNAVRFNGTDESGTRATTPDLTQPVTIYIVFKSITFTSPDRVYSANSANNIVLFQFNSSPELDIFAGAVVVLSPALSLGNYGIVTSVFNVALSGVRLNNNTIVSGNAGAGNGNGFSLAKDNATGNYGNIEVAYIIIRDGADNKATQDIYISFLKNRFGL